MSQKTRAWGFLAGVTLLLGCGKPNEGDGKPTVQCSTNTACPEGFKCNFGGANPANPASLGVCEYQECGLTVACKKKYPDCPLPQETAMCDSENNEKYCGCVRPNSEPVPPTTAASGDTPTTGAGNKP